MYSGERSESLAAVKQHLEAARASAVVPIRASHYAAIADSFFDVTITAAGPGSWRIANRSALQTVRLDHSATLEPDYGRSSGILGHTHHAGALYVALDPAHDMALLTIARPDRTTVAGPSRPILVDSRWPLSGLEIGACGFEVNAQGFGPGQMTWDGLRPGPYTIMATIDGGAAATLSADADEHGRLRFAVQADAIGGIRLVVKCGS